MVTMGVRLAPIQNKEFIQETFWVLCDSLNRKDIQHAEELHYSVIPLSVFEELKSQC